MTTVETEVSLTDAFASMGYVPHVGQRPIHGSLARHRVAACGRRFGKSEIGGHELALEPLITRGMLSYLRDTGTRREFWIVGPEYTDSEKEFRKLWDALALMGAKEYFDRPGTYNNPESGEMIISMFDRKLIIDAKSAKYPGTLVGEGLSGVVMAEAAKLKPTIWTKFIRPTLADFQGWSLWLSTPEGRNHFHEAYLRGLDPAEQEWEAWRRPSWVNPIVFPLGRNDPEILAMEREMSESLFGQEVEADFSEYVGRVFKAFDEEIHVGDLQYDPKLPLYGAVDYGWTHPFVWLVIQVDVWDNVYVLGEYRATEKDITEIADELVEWSPARNAVAFAPDPEAPGDTNVLRNKLKLKVLPNTGGELKYRLERIRKWLKQVPEHFEDGHPEKQPKLKIDRSCKDLIREMGDYRYPETKQEGDFPKEKPLDKDDHGPEALGRFMIAHFGMPTGGAPVKGRARVRNAKVSR